MRGYTYNPPRGKVVARALGAELHISPKKTYEVMNAIRGLPLDDARSFLERVRDLKSAVPFRRYNQETAHHKESGPGRYPVKVAKEVLKVLANAEANADYEGMDTDNLRVTVASCARGRILKSYMPRAHGRSSAWNEQTTNVEIVLTEED
ncbi:MAG: 50S ribosomal protein L22 [Euryarchaeota archaeon]|nr:50S ribosomal protein L22 [Euryarchaeota archaeon]MDE1835734.1 50S ribosomal protein L22 [Euryarchaeota archaeon]MDE1880841.1 50S ribosomal protein L22 [Euryarchaeota archaeon]MDE2043925.1 50S ribosomal protein L22 [Thermoplasmata archaeon]